MHALSDGRSPYLGGRTRVSHIVVDAFPRRALLMTHNPQKVGSTAQDLLDRGAQPVTPQCRSDTFRESNATLVNGDNK